MAWGCSIHPSKNSAPAFPLEIDNVGHWVQHEASAEVSDQLLKFLRTVKPA
jgi:pimeloyl-ACP methyl ester carboxylesterase